MIGQLYSVVIDAPDPHALATFYAELLGLEIKGDPGDDWVWATGGGHRLAFQEAPNLQPPDWPDPDRPQQFHLDVQVADVLEAEPKVLALAGEPARAATSASTPTRSGTPSAWCGTRERRTARRRPDEGECLRRRLGLRGHGGRRQPGGRARRSRP